MPLNIEEEKKFEALRKNCRDLGVPSPPEIHIGFKVQDKNGDLLFEDRQRGHSWTRNFYNHLFGASIGGLGVPETVFGAGHWSLRRQTGGISVVGTAQYYRERDKESIVIGTGTSAFSPEDYDLAAQIAHGNSIGEMYYEDGQTNDGTLLYDDTSGSESFSYTFNRVFINNSGAGITVSETGIRYINSYWGGAGLLVERSVLAPTVTVPNGAQLTVSYDISMDFSAIDGD